MNEYVNSLFNRYRPQVTPDQVRETFLARKTDLEAQLAQAESELQAQIQPLYDQVNAFKAVHEENTRNLSAELTEVNAGLEQLDNPTPDEHTEEQVG